MGTVRLDQSSGDDLVTNVEREVTSSHSECSSGTEKVSRIKDVGLGANDRILKIPPAVVTTPVMKSSRR
jgi:hypothetical protein